MPTRTQSSYLTHALLLLATLSLVACAAGRTPTATPSAPTVAPTVAPVTPTLVSPAATSTQTHIPRASPTASSTLPPTATATLTATPTPTVLPLAVLGSPRRALARTPVPENGAPCGIVDLLDFPLAPPDAAGASGGSDFGQYRSRYDLYHAGEDWRVGQSGSSFGKPVYSIGHGQVTFAQPYGWGADKGTVIVRHAFPDGRSVLSFYGHLDPPSVVLGVGDCVVRGQRVGRIGRPRTSPHLHFETRTHTPAAPGRGYTAKDPTLSGWLPPSQLISQSRIAALPGVQWVRSPAGRSLQGVGMLDPDTYVARDGDQLLAVDVRDGSVRWRHQSAIHAADALIHPDLSAIYVASASGKIEALRVPDRDSVPAAAESPLESLWQIAVEGAGAAPVLMPLPDGGVLLSTRLKMVGLDASGERLWERDGLIIPLDWEFLDDQLLLAAASADGSLWKIDREGAVAWEAQAGVCFSLAAAGGRVFAYDERGIVRLDPQARASEVWYALPDGSPRRDDLVVLPGGGVLATHADPSGGTLLALSPDGALRWQLASAHVLREQGHLLALDGRAFLVARQRETSSTVVSVYEVDLEHAALVHILEGSSRHPVSADTWASAIDGSRMLIHAGSTGMFALDVQLAIEAARRP